MAVPTRSPAGDDPGSTSLGLLAGVRVRDPDAWQRLTILYGPLVYGWARRAGLRSEDAADVTQEVFRTLAAGSAPRFGNPGDTFRGWLWTVTRNKVRDLWRQAGAVAAGGSAARELLLTVPEDPSAESMVGGLGGLLGRAVELARAEFEDRTWQAFWRTAVDGRAAADVGRELGITANAVYVARSRILRRLRELLADTPSTPDHTPR